MIWLFYVFAGNSKRNIQNIPITQSDKSCSSLITLNFLQSFFQKRQQKDSFFKSLTVLSTCKMFIRSHILKLCV